MTKIIPAILAHDTDKLTHQLQIIEKLVKRVHIDIMDGRFVANKSIDIQDIAQIETSLKKTVHLMVTRPEDYYQEIARYNFEGIVIHLESFADSRSLLASIAKAKNSNLKIFITLNPETIENQLTPEIVKEVDWIQVMTSEPGFGGKFNIPNTVGKVARLNRMFPQTPIGVDGGINESNISDYYKVGARIFNIGSAIFEGEPKYTIKNFQSILDGLEKQLESSKE